MDWSKTALGAPDTWSAALKTAVSLVTANRLPQLLCWGPDCIAIYNDAYVPVLGAMHPGALGQPLRDVWPEAAAVLGAMIEQPFYSGPSNWTDDVQLEIRRYGYAEETHFSFAYSPVPDDDAPYGVGGVLCTVIEVTDKIVSERRLAALRDVAARAADARTVKDACSGVAKALDAHPMDAPFSLVYTLDDDGERARLASASGAAAGDPVAPEVIALRGKAGVWPLGLAAKKLQTVIVPDLADRFSVLPQGPWSDQPHTALVVPLSTGGKCAGFLVAGTSSRLKLDEQHRSFFDLVASQIAAAIGNAKASEQERALEKLNAELEERVAAEVAERHLLAGIVEGSEAFVMVSDMDFRLMAINHAAADQFERLYGVCPVVGDSLLEILAHRPSCQAQVRNAWARVLGGEEYTVVAQIGDAGHDQRSYEIKASLLRDASGAQIGAYQFVYDVTERVREQERLAQAEEQLRQAQKMEAMGQLTGGVAHDFNNLLTPIIGSLDMLQRDASRGERERRLLSAAFQSADRARTLVQRLLAFARRQPLQPTAVDIGSIVAGMTGLLTSTSGPQVRIAVDIAPDLELAKADPNQLEMALLNLSVNARDAMPNGGTIRISAANAEVAADDRKDLKPGRYVRLSVADTGVGMDEATLARAVEPFFSTKGVGKGTGLGLSMVHGLTQQLGGAMTMSSRLGEGTTVELWLPRSERPPQAEEDEAEAGEHQPGRGLALLVDDEELVRLSTAAMLTELGYSVQEAGSAEEAIALIDHGMRPDLVVTDHLMPGMSGADLARAVEDRFFGAPVLIISGYAEADGIHPALPRLNKPFVNAELAAALAALH